MRNRLFALGLALLFTLVQTAPALAATPKAPADWASVQSISTGTKIAVRTKDGDHLTGRFDSATETNINFTHDGRSVSLTRESIKRVDVARGKNRLVGALVGGGAGTGVGAAVGGYTVARTDHFGGDPLPIGMVVGAGIGAAIGAAIGLGTNYETAYEAP
ncbi:MAG: hypothetical protein QOJ70_86 [Acidobacteriota bacterium]|jgi:hypothetical protein|nr:hypothetical protein [Acidobacteriota bacterium]